MGVKKGGIPLSRAGFNAPPAKASIPRKRSAVRDAEFTIGHRLLPIFHWMGLHLYFDPTIPFGIKMRTRIMMMALIASLKTGSQ